MKRLILMSICYLVASCFLSIAQGAIVLPQEIPYVFNGHVYTSVIAVLNTANGYTNHLYCADDIYIGTAENRYFSWRCGQVGQYNYYLIRTYNPDSSLLSKNENSSWGPVTSGGDTYSGISDDTIKTSVSIYYQPVWYLYPTDEIRFSVNWGVPAETPLSFPLSGYTAYTAPASSVMDQSTLGDGATYGGGADGKVITFEGEVGDVGPYNGSTCYRKADNTTFGTSYNYVGTSTTGGSYYICYDAHPGYDYPVTIGTAISASADGTLCIATSSIQQQNPSDVWRDTDHCPLSTAGGTTWSGYHTFYVIHEGLHINGSTDDYMTVFLHNNDLETVVRGEIEQHGYTTVTRGTHIAEVGGWGPNGANSFGPHMHFEVYKWNTSTSAWDRVDPYGNGTDNVLWNQ